MLRISGGATGLTKTRDMRMKDVRGPGLAGFDPVEKRGQGGECYVRKEVKVGRADAARTRCGQAGLNDRAGKAGFSRADRPFQ